MKRLISMRSRIGLLILLLFAFTDLPLLSQDSLQYQWERFSVSLGGFLTTMNSNISIDGQEMGLGVNLNLEDALGLSTSSTVIRGEAEYNFGSKKRSHVRMGYFGLFRNASKILEAELEIGGSVFPVGAEINSKYNMQIYRGMYDYAFFRDERIMLAASVGLYILPVDFSLRTGEIIDESANIIAPLPVVGFRNAFIIAPKVTLKQNVEFLYVKTASFRGLISDLNIWLEYNPFKHLGFGLGFNTFRFNFSAYDTIGNRDFKGSVSTEFSGLLFYGRYYL
jgi:hypothetical protein